MGNDISPIRTKKDAEKFVRYIKSSVYAIGGEFQYAYKFTKKGNVRKAIGYNRRLPGLWKPTYFLLDWSKKGDKECLPYYSEPIIPVTKERMVEIVWKDRKAINSYML